MVAPAKKKLLVLDVNGLLLDTYFRNEKRPNRPADGKVNSHHVYRRPYCNEFIEFCFENFEIGIWSSSKQHNVDGFINFIFGDLKNKLLFSWHQADCTDTGLKVPGNRYKPVFLKELSKLWNNVKLDLPWEKGEYGPSNTLLIDDSPYKALRNPPYTAVFPDPYKVSNKFDDSLGGALRKYLEGLASASSVQHYVKHHTFGQLPIGKGSPHWSFFRNILLPMGDSAPYKEEEENDMVIVATPNLEKNISLENSGAGLHTGNGQHSESSTCIGKRKKKRRNRPVASTDQSSGPGMDEDNGVANVAMLNMEKNRNLENREINLQSGNGQQSESSSRSGRRKKRHKAHLTRGTNQSSVPDMEEENGMFNMAMLNMEKSISLENRKVNLQSGNGQQSESSSRSGKRKKKHKYCLGTSTNESSVPGKEEENSIANVAVPNMEESIENRKENLLSGNRQQSESSLRSGKRKKRHRDGLATSTNQSSVSGMEEENSVINVEKTIKNKDKAMAAQTDKDQCGSGQQSESSSRSGKRKKRSRDGLATSINQSSVPGMEVENSAVNVAILNVEKAFKNKAMAAQTDEDRGNKPYIVTGRKFHDHNGFGYGDKGHHYKPVHFRENSHLNSNRWSSSHAPKNSYGGSQASYFPGRQFEADRGHKNGFYTSNNMYCRNAVDTNFPPHQLEGYINDGQEQEYSIANVAMPNMEESIENRKENLLSGNRQQSESSLRSGKWKKMHRDGLATSTNQSSVSGMEEENRVINVEKTIKNKDKEMAAQTDKDHCGSGQQSESSLRSGKRKKRSRDGLATSTNQSSVPGMEVENSAVNVAILNVEKAFKNKAMAAQIDEDHCGNKPYTVTGRKFHDHNGFGYGDKGHHYKPVHFRANSHLNSNRWSSSHAPKNSHGGSQASYFPGRQFEADRGHKNGYYTSNNMYCRNAVDTNFPPHQLEGYINDGQDRWHMHGGYNFQDAPPHPSYYPSHTVYPVFQRNNPTQRATEFRCPVMQPQFPSSQSHAQVPAKHCGTQYQGHGSNFQYNKNNSKSRHSGRRKD